MSSKPFCIFLAFLFCCFAPLSSAQQPTSASKSKSALTEFDGPNASSAAGFGTQAFANNDFGFVVGSFTDQQIIPHGFLRTPDGKIIPFDAPGADVKAGDNAGTVAYAINDLGVITGQYADTKGIFHGFILYPNGFFTDYDEPNAGTESDEGQGTVPANINLEGDTAGFYVDGSGNEHGFIRGRNGKFVTVDPPGAEGTMICLETCLNDEGAVTGFFGDNNGVHGFVRSPDGKFTTFDTSEGGPAPNQITIAASINDLGQITGYSLDPNGYSHSFVRSPEGKITFFDDPAANNAQGASAFAINLFGATTGEYLDANSASHGFLRVRANDFENFDAPDAGSTCIGSGPFAICEGTRPSALNASGQVTGWYIDVNGANHGFVWNPIAGSDADESLSSENEARDVAPALANPSGQTPTLRDRLSRFSSRDRGTKLIFDKWLARAN